MWIVFAILSAVFAALTSILAKVGIEDESGNFRFLIVYLTGSTPNQGLSFISGENQDRQFLVKLF